MSSDVNSLAHILRGSAWSVLLRWGIRGIGLLNTIILARLLTPEDFGLVAMAMVVVAFLETVADLGIGVFLIRERNLTRAHSDTGWTLQVLQGLCIAAVVVATSPLLTLYFSEPRLLEALWVVAMAPAIRGFRNVGVELFLRNGNFRSDFRFRMLTRVCGAVVTVAICLWFRSYWGILIGFVSTAAFEVIASYIVHGHRSRFSVEKWREMFGFSMHVVNRSLSNFVNSKADFVILAKFADVATMGLYSVASGLVLIIGREIAGGVARGAYPAYSRLGEDPHQLSAIFLQSLMSALFICVPTCLGLAVVSYEFIAIIFGSKWLSAAPLLPWLALSGLLEAIALLMTGSILIASGHERLSAYAGWCQVAIRLPIVAVGAILGGVDGTIRALLMASVLWLPLAFLFLRSAVPITLLQAWRATRRPLTAGLAMVAALVVAKDSFPDDLALRFAMDIAFAGSVYLAAMYVVWRLEGSPEGPESKLFQLLRGKFGSSRVS